MPVARCHVVNPIPGNSGFTFNMWNPVAELFNYVCQTLAWMPGSWEFVLNVFWGYIYILLVYSKFALSLHPKTSWLSVTISGKPLVQHHVYPLNGTRHFFVVKSLGGSCMSVAICLEKKYPFTSQALYWSCCCLREVPSCHFDPLVSQNNMDCRVWIKMITWNLSRSDCSHLQHWQKLGFGVIWAGGVAQGVLSNKIKWFIFGWIQLDQLFSTIKISTNYQWQHTNICIYHFCGICAMDLVEEFLELGRKVLDSTFGMVRGQ